MPFDNGYFSINNGGFLFELHEIWTNIKPMGYKLNFYDNFGVDLIAN